MKLSSKNRLMPMHRELFPDDTLFHRIARSVCLAGVLPRKELYEAWETARRVRRVQSFISGDDAWTFRYTYAPTTALDIYPCNRFCGGTERRSHAFCTDLVL